MKNKEQIYIVSLTMTSIQNKLVRASSKEEAIEIANDTEWCEKEEVLDTEVKARKAIPKGKEKKGEYPDYYENSYIFEKEEDDA